jgi:hypothetical protein
MKNQKSIRQKFKSFFYDMLQEFSEKFDIKISKKIADIFFKLSEKIALKFNYFLDLYIRYYDSMVNCEINLASISKTDKVVYVGCGSIPASSILIAQKTNADVVGVDKNKNTVKNARHCVNKYNLSDKINIKNAEASNFSFDDFNVIIISHGITPLDDFLKYLSKKASKKSKIILRTFSDDEGALCESDKFILDLFKVNKIIRYVKQGRVISVLLSFKD